MISGLAALAAGDRLSCPFRETKHFGNQLVFSMFSALGEQFRGSRPFVFNKFSALGVEASERQKVAINFPVFLPTSFRNFLVISLTRMP